MTHAYDVIVVGAGPGGAVTAALLAERGRRVVVLERQQVPRRKICGEFLCPSTVRALDRLGLLGELDLSRSRAIDGMLLVSPAGIAVESRFRCAGRAGLSMARTDLDGGLAAAAARRGARVLRGATMLDLQRSAKGAAVEMRAADGTTRWLHAPVVVGADGRFSLVARRAGLEGPPTGPGRGTIHAWFDGVEGLESRGEMHFFPDGSYLGLDPLYNGVLNVNWVTDGAVVQAAQRARDGGRRLLDLVGGSKQLRGRFRRAKAQGAVRYLRPLRVEVKAPAGDRVLLVGDAGGFLDPLTGEGIHVAVVTAELAADTLDEALRVGRFDAAFLARYSKGRRRLLRSKGVVTRLFQRLLGHPRLMDGIARRLEGRPAAADILMGVVGNLRRPAALLRPAFWMPLLVPPGGRQRGAGGPV